MKGIRGNTPKHHFLIINNIFKYASGEPSWLILKFEQTTLLNTTDFSFDNS